jgi:hypothetical protein
MTPAKKPAFLKTFSEFTIDELRKMPLSQVISLFFREVGFTFTERTRERKYKKPQDVKKNTETPLMVVRVKKSPSFPLKMPVIQKPSLHLRVPKVNSPTVRFKIPTVQKPDLHINTTEFNAAMKRVFTPGPVRTYEKGKKTAAKKGKVAETETIVFSNANGQSSTN